MKGLYRIMLLFGFCLILISIEASARTNSRVLKKVVATKNLVAVWDFREKEGTIRNALGTRKYPLKEFDGTIPRVSEGPLSGYSAQFGNKAYLCLPGNQTGKLNIYGKGQGLSLIHI